MQRPRVRVTIGDPRDQPVDLVVLPGRRDSERATAMTIKAPKWTPPSGPERPLAEVYRRVVRVATERRARSLAIPSALVLGSWPMEEVTRVALTVFMSTPSSLRDVIVAVPTPAMLEVWAEALAREP